MSRTGSSTSSTDACPAARRHGAIAASLAAALAAGLVLLGGCGFEPVYGERSQASGDALARFEIALIADRTGQMLRNELLARMQPYGEGRTATGFVLKIEVTEARQDLAIRKDDSATRANLSLNAVFHVLQPGGKEPLFNGAATAVVSHNILTSDFATISAREDARRRGVRQLADRIKERLSVWLIQTGGRRVES